MAWGTRKLGELTSKIGSGATPRGGSTVYRPSGTTFIRSQNVHDHEMRLEDVAYIDDDSAAALSSVAVRPGDVLINITGDSIARTSLVDLKALPARVSQHVAILRPTDELDSRYLQKFLTNPSFKDHLITISSGGTRKALTKATLESLDIALPPLAVQRAIAEVLGALDDKIAANLRVAKTADHLAQAEFLMASRSSAMSDKRFDDLATVGGGGTPSSKVASYWNGSVAWVTPTDVTALQGPYIAETSRTITEAGLAACSSPLYPVGSILMTSRATIGAFAIAEIPIAVNQGFIVVVPNDEGQRYWLFHEMRTRINEFTAFANGATFLELSRRNFRQFKVRLAEERVMREFEAIASGLHDRASAALQENASLAATRDALLPALMSGKLRVKDAERQVEAVV